MRPSRPLIVVVLATLVTPWLAAACSGDDGGEPAVGPDREALVAAAERAFDEGTARFSLDAAVRGVAEGTVPVTGEGVVDAGAGRVAATADVAELFAAVAGSLNLPAMLGSLFDDPVDLVSDGGTLFLHLPVLALASGSSADWARVDLDELGGGAPGAFAAATDPVTMLGLLHGAAEVRDGGGDQVRGDAVTRFDGTLTVDGALDRAPDDVGDRLEAAARALGLDEAQRQAPFPFTAWVDAGGRLRAFSVSFTPDGPASGADVRIELFDFGTDADIDLPDDSADVTDLFAGMGG